MVVADFRDGVRALARSPMIAVMAIVTLGAGIALNATVFGILKPILLDSLGYPEADRLVVVRSEAPSMGDQVAWGASTAQYFHLRNNSKTLVNIEAIEHIVVSVLPTNEILSEAVLARASSVTVGTTRIKGMQAEIGRLFEKGDDAPGAPLAAVLSYRFWKSEFGGDVAIVGKSIRVDGGNEAVVTVIGVAKLLEEDIETDIWVPLYLDEVGQQTRRHNLYVVARLKSGVSIGQAQSEVDRLTLQLPDEYPEVYGQYVTPGTQFGLRTVLHPMKSYSVGSIGLPLWTIQIAVAAVLLIAWINMTYLLLARAETQRRSLLIRATLGASLRSIFQYFLGQQLVVLGVSLVLGLFVAWWALGYMAPLRVPIPRWHLISLDGGVILAALLLGLGYVLCMSGCLSAKFRLGEAARFGSRTRAQGRSKVRTHSLQIVGQIALAIVLINTAGLLTVSLNRMLEVDLGIVPSGVVKMTIVAGGAYPDDSSWWELLKTARERVASIPGVIEVGFVESLPLASQAERCSSQGFRDESVYELVEETGRSMCTVLDLATPGYFQAMGIPLLLGRTFEDDDLDNPSQGSAIVSRQFVEQFWPGENPIGKMLAPREQAMPWYTVVGVVGDVPVGSVREGTTPHVYYPLVPQPSDAGWWVSWMQLVVKVDSTTPEEILPGVRRVLASIDPDVVVDDAEAMTSEVRRSTVRERAVVAILNTSGASTLVLAVLGVASLVGYISVHRRTEMGIRMALGARLWKLRATVMGRAIGLICFGIVVGIPVALLAGRTIAEWLYDAPPYDPLILALSAGVVIASAIIGSWVGTSGLNRLSPAQILRDE